MQTAQEANLNKRRSSQHYLLSTQPNPQLGLLHFHPHGRLIPHQSNSPSQDHPISNQPQLLLKCNLLESTRIHIRTRRKELPSQIKLSMDRLENLRNRDILPILFHVHPTAIPTPRQPLLSKSQKYPGGQLKPLHVESHQECIRFREKREYP